MYKGNLIVTNSYINYNSFLYSGAWLSYIHISSGNKLQKMMHLSKASTHIYMQLPLIWLFDRVYTALLP